MSSESTAFGELLALSDQLTANIHLHHTDDGEKGGDTGQKIVSLLCPTGLDFLVSWIAFMRMGYGVVFVA